jgi:hypothetical protein
MGTAWIWLLRATTAALGVFGLAWALSTFSLSWNSDALQRVAARIAIGDRFKAESLAGLETRMRFVENSSFCSPSALHAATMIRVHALEIAFEEGARRSIESGLAELDEVARRTLLCSPTNSFSWLVLFWALNLSEGYNDAHLNMLRLSYEQGPNEAWIALKRNPLALVFYERFPQDLRDQVAQEFAGLVKSSFFAQAADTFLRQGFPNREALTMRLDFSDDRRIRIFARALRDRGYDFAIPGDPPGHDRPWN